MTGRVLPATDFWGDPQRVGLLVALLYASSHTCIKTNGITFVVGFVYAASHTCARDQGHDLVGAARVTAGRTPVR